LVTGATGPHGGAVARGLLSGGYRVRAVTRNPADEPTPLQMADALSAAGGSSVRFWQIDLGEVAARSADLAAMYGFLAGAGYDVDALGVRARCRDIKWTTFGEWASRSSDAA
jgi:nucleoside-diphosphate-sugar epimerase